MGCGIQPRDSAGHAAIETPVIRRRKLFEGGTAKDDPVAEVSGERCAMRCRVALPRGGPASTFYQKRGAVSEATAVDALGVLEVLGNGAAFIRRREAGFVPGRRDVYVNPKLVSGLACELETRSRESLARSQRVVRARR